MPQTHRGLRGGLMSKAGRDSRGFVGIGKFMRGCGRRRDCDRCMHFPFLFKCLLFGRLVLGLFGLSD